MRKSKFSVDAVISGKGSCREIAAKYGIPSPSILAGWIKKYNANMELKDYIPEKAKFAALEKGRLLLGDTLESF
ncbi:MAG: transposase [Schwartzia sp.]|nr:transposase [Schwartzia sp. (in: firmicutes)]